MYSEVTPYSLAWEIDNISDNRLCNVRASNAIKVLCNTPNMHVNKEAKKISETLKDNFAINCGQE